MHTLCNIYFFPLKYYYWVPTIFSAIQGGRAIERNCWRLLNAPKEATQVQKLFELLTTYGYCKPSNILLGPVLRIYLNRFVVCNYSCKLCSCLYHDIFSAAIYRKLLILTKSVGANIKLLLYNWN